MERSSFLWVWLTNDLYIYLLTSSDSEETETAESYTSHSEINNLFPTQSFLVFGDLNVQE